MKLVKIQEDDSVIEEEVVSAIVTEKMMSRLNCVTVESNGEDVTVKMICRNNTQEEIVERYKWLIMEAREMAMKIDDPKVFDDVMSSF